MPDIVKQLDSKLRAVIDYPSVSLDVANYNLESFKASLRDAVIMLSSLSGTVSSVSLPFCLLCLPFSLCLSVCLSLVFSLSLAPSLSPPCPCSEKCVCVYFLYVLGER